jgi:hypothetical protein
LVAASVASVRPSSARQRSVLIGPTLNLVGSGNDNPRISLPGTGASRPLDLSYGVFPSLAATMTGASSTLALSYAFGRDWTDATTTVRSDSHAASFSLSHTFNSRWGLRLSDSFTLTSDTTSFNLFSGAAPADPTFLFEPTAVRQSARTNSAAFAISRALSTRSTISVELSHSLRTYGRNNPFQGTLSNQQNAAAGIVFSRRTNRRDTWSAGFRSERYFFDDFDDSILHSAYVGYGYQIANNTALEVTVGASRIESLGAGGNAVGYNTAVTLDRTFNQGSIALAYAQTTGQASGLGANSNTRRVGVALGRRFGNISLSLDASGFDAEGTLNNPFETRGLAGSGSVGIAITDTFSIRGGAQIQRYSQAMDFGFTQRRAFISISYSHPDLWQFR